MANIFPIFEPTLAATRQELPLYKDVQWDFEADTPVYVNGTPVIVERQAAILTWAYNALSTARGHHEVFPLSYGNDVESLVGQQYSEEYKKAQAAEYIRTCLLQSPYITAVENIAVAFADNVLSASFQIVSVYGTIGMEV